jgi:hypothetical protein
MKRLHVALLCLSVAPLASAAPPPDVTLTWVEKYLTYAQDHENRLTLTDAHFLAEIIFDSERDFDTIHASLRKNGSGEPLATWGGSDKRAFTNGYFYTRKTRSFDSLEAIDRLHPADNSFVWTISGPSGEFVLDPIRIGGPELRTQVPKPSTIRLQQGGTAVTNYDAIDAAAPLTISWDPFVGGGPLEGSVWSDLVFVLVSDCHGEVAYTGGAPGTDEDFVDYRDTSATVPAGRLRPGEPYVVFISQVNYVDFNESHGIGQLAANSFATELPIRTSGQAAPGACTSELKPAQYLWTRKTRGKAMESWPTLVDHW